MAQTHTAADEAPTFDRQTLWMVAAILIGGLAVLLDTTIVAVALQSLAVELQTSVTTIQWVTTAYLLAVGVTIPLAAWAQARWGGRRVWLALPAAADPTQACFVARFVQP